MEDRWMNIKISFCPTDEMTSQPDEFIQKAAPSVLAEV